MFQEKLYEESAGSLRATKEARWYQTFKVFAIIFFAVAAFILMFAFTLVPFVLDTLKGNTAAIVFSLVQYFGFILLLIGAGLVLWFLKNRFNVSYDYLFVEDELRITKVFNGKKRKHLVTIEADKILQLGWVESDAFERLIQGLEKGKKPKYFTPNREPAEGKEFYYILRTSSVEKSIYVIEARQMMLEYLVFAAGRNKLVKK